MDASGFESLNGSRFPAGSPLFGSANRAFRYGDGLFETMRLHRGRPLFWNEHMERLTAGALMLHFELPPDLDELFSETIALAQMNGVETGRARLTVFRADGGYYAPLSDRTSWHLEVVPLSGDFGADQQKGLTAGWYADSAKPIDKNSSLKTLNALYYVLAGGAARRKGMDELIISNTSEGITEFISGNLFLVYGNTIATPPLSEGCMAGIMRRKVIEILQEQKIDVNEKKLTGNDVEQASELWCTNVIKGVSCISRLGELFFTCKLANEVNQHLNEKWLR